MPTGDAVRSLVLILLAAVLVLGSLTILAFPSEAQALSPNPLQFFGSAARGWGRNSTSFTSPGPFLHYNTGTVLNIALHSTDLQGHNFFVDYDNSCATSCSNASKPSSGTFTTSGSTWFNLTLSREGNFSYRCIFHPTVMFGTLLIGNPGGGGLNLTLIIAIVVIVLVVGAVVGVLLMRRRPKTPPST